MKTVSLDRPTFIFASLALASSLLTAQRSWVVDSMNRPGTDFTDLPPALVAASPGDTLVVRSGTYTPSRTGKGLRLLGGPGVNFRLAITQLENLVVSGLPAGQTFVMQGFVLDDPILRTALLLADNRGQVFVEDVQLGQLGTPFSPMLRAGVVVSNCAQVSFTGAKMFGRPACVIADSTVAITASALIGGDAGQLQQRTWFSQPGLYARRSTLHLARSSSLGGAGASTYQGERPASAAIGLLDCRVSISGDSASRIEAGTAVTTPRAGIEASGGTLTIDPSVSIVPKGTPVPIWGNARLVITRLPSLKAAGDAPGGTLRTDLYAPSGWRQILAAGLPGTPLPLPPGALWIDPLFLTPLDAGVMDATQHRALSVPVPNLPALRGWPLAIQVIASGGNSTLLSNPAVVVLD